MVHVRGALLCAALAICTGVLPSTVADVVVDYRVAAGGKNNEPLNGLAARGTFAVSGNKLSILLDNISTGLPKGFDTSDSLLVSLGMNLPVDFANGTAAVIGPGSKGLGTWSSRTAGDSVAEEWLWTNDYGGDLMERYKHIISTSNGQGGGDSFRFDNGDPKDVSGPFGGMAANPPLMNIPDNQPAVSHSIRFDLTLAGNMTEDQLRRAVEGSIVEFGSDMQYLAVPEPASLVLMLGATLVLRRR